jgi:hypothetical protein
MTDGHRARVLEACRAAPEDSIVVVHGTDTMAETAAVVGAAGLAKTVVFTGAMIPYSVQGSDALFNLGFAHALARTLPRGAYVINVGRGEQMVEADLRALLDEGHLAGAALDVYEREPPSADNWVWAHPLVLATPHIAGEVSREIVAQQTLDRRAGEVQRQIASLGRTQRRSLAQGLEELRAQGAAAVARGDARRDAVREYDAALDNLAGGARERLDEAWRIFGRVIARQKLVELRDRVEELLQ